MRVQISEELKGYFKGKVYMSRWKDGSFLVFNEDEYKKLKDRLNNLKDSKNDGLIRFIQFGMVEVVYEKDILNIPESFIGDNEKTADFYMKKGDFGIVLSPL